MHRRSGPATRSAELFARDPNAPFYVLRSPGPAEHAAVGTLRPEVRPLVSVGDSAAERPSARRRRLRPGQRRGTRSRSGGEGPTEPEPDGHGLHRHRVNQVVPECTTRRRIGTSRWRTRGWPSRSTRSSRSSRRALAGTIGRCARSTAKSSMARAHPGWRRFGVGEARLPLPGDDLVPGRAGGAAGSPPAHPQAPLDAGRHRRGGPALLLPDREPHRD